MNNLLNRFTTASCTLVFAIFASLSMLSTATLASTPDGETPANEGVCDPLKGGTGGLYGLCVAYCEAQDLDSFDKEPPRTKILENYNKKKQAGDPDMPCMQVPCPCWNDAELASIGNDGFAMCTAGANKLEIRSTTLGGPRHSADADTSVGAERCRYIFLGDPRTIRSFSITAEEAQSCFAQVEQACVGF